ncbi:hypothetical protein XENORESO_000473 [Xenotaenia resolanae]|uniref:Uncharacterized protein n=1 Tax=Xenotaenia resolanae TaxID=208358 RepID=A0ABV0WD56_9TELE
MMQRAMTACTECFRPPRDNSSSAGQRNCLGFTSFSIRDLLRSKEPDSSLKLRTMDGVNEVGEVKVSRLQVEEETEVKSPENKSSVLCDALHGSVQDKENSPIMRAALCSQVCKLYRFQTEDHRWLLVREQMSESPLSFSLPKQLLSVLIQEHTDRVLEVKELCDLSPHWDGLRHDVIFHCNQLISCYQQTQAELHKLSTSSCFKASSSKSDRHLQFISTNLHSQRMEVTSPDSSGNIQELLLLLEAVFPSSVMTPVHGIQVFGTRSSRSELLLITTTRSNMED